jgi:hypothetical protein
LPSLVVQTGKAFQFFVGELVAFGACAEVVFHRTGADVAFTAVRTEPTGSRQAAVADDPRHRQGWYVVLHLPFDSQGS